MLFVVFGFSCSAAVPASPPDPPVRCPTEARVSLSLVAGVTAAHFCERSWTVSTPPKSADYADLVALMAKSAPKPEVVVTADKKVMYAAVVALLDALLKGGYTNVVFAAEP